MSKKAPYDAYSPIYICYDNHAGDNVKLENVSKMLGHTNTRMTLHYAHIMNESLAQEMNKVAEIMGE